MPHTLSLRAMLALSIVLFAVSAKADVKLAAIFSDHAVLQADAAVPVWGWAEPGEEVTVALAGQSQTVKAGADGKWMAKLGKLKATAEPQTLTVRGTNTLTVRDVLVGEVWLASGQSNMDVKLTRAANHEQERAAANYPLIRVFTVNRSAQPGPQSDCGGVWELCSPETVDGFSAVAYFFGRELHQKLNVPVGMVNSSVGGTDIASWTSEEAQLKIPALKAQIDLWAQNDATYDLSKAKAKYEKEFPAWLAAVKQAKADGKPLPRKPAAPMQPRLNANCPAHLFNGRIAPLIPYAIRGAIWYQGEHNTSTSVKGQLYYVQLPLLIEDWRARWGTDFPFAWVQLPNLDRIDSRPVVREAMLQTLRVKHTGMAITIDIGEAKDNHPKNKQEVARRLALWALGTVYGQPVPATSGPLPDGHQVRDNEVVLTFRHTNAGLVSHGAKLKDGESTGGELQGFIIAGADRQWKPAQARIDGETVVVWNPEVKEPVAVRYSWAGNPDGNLFNGAGLPASPFRTDNWQP